MANYIDRALTQGEKVLHTGHISLWSLTGLLVLGLLLLPLFGVGLLFLLAAFIRYKTTELAITNKRVIAKFGFISRRTVELNITKVESIQVDQSILGRVLDYGSLVLSGAGNPQAPIPGISNPMTFRRIFMEAQEMAQLNAAAGR